LATRSAAKAYRQSLKRRLRNRAVLSASKTAMKRAVASLAGGNLEAARLEVRAAISALDGTVAKGVIHPNNAARHKSRLLLKYNAAVAALQAPAQELRPSSKRPSQGRPKRTAPKKAKK